MVFSYRQAHLHPPSWSRVFLRRDVVVVDHVSERVHRVPQLARHVRVSRRHDRDVRLCLLRVGVRSRRRRSRRNRFLLLGRCVSCGHCFF